MADEPGKELTLLRFARLCFERGPSAARMLGDADVAAAFALERAVNNEGCKYIEFLRFEQRDAMLGSIIHPRHNVLPLLRGHFCSRLPDEDFMIFDATHGVALLRRSGRVCYMQMKQYTPAPDPAEEALAGVVEAFFPRPDHRGTPQPDLPAYPCPQAVLAGYVRDAAGPGNRHLKNRLRKNSFAFCRNMV